MFRLPGMEFWSYLHTFLNEKAIREIKEFGVAMQPQATATVSTSVKAAQFEVINILKILLSTSHICISATAA